MHPTVFFILSLAVLWLGMVIGTQIRIRHDEIINRERKIVTVLEGALLTLFGLLIGFTFSMAVSRYDTRKKLVVKEANAIGTTWLRTAVLPDPVRSEEQGLLRQYVQQRLRYLAVGSDLAGIEDSQKRTSELQGRIWAVASNYAADNRDAVTSLFLITLNDSIDASEERTAESENRIPGEAWEMLLFVGCAATLLVGLNVRPRSWVLQAMLPVVLAGTLGMTMDMDSPRYGLIRITQESMERVAQEMTTLPQQER